MVKNLVEILHAISKSSDPKTTLKKISTAAGKGSNTASQVGNIGTSISDGINEVAAGVRHIKSDDPLTQISGVMGIISTVTGFMGP